MGNSCSQSSDCRRGGQCCSVEGTCSSQLVCNIDDGRFQVGSQCVQHSDCATGCCDQSEGICSYNGQVCPDVPNPYRIYYMIGLFTLAVLILVFSLVSIYIKQKRKRFKMKHQIDPRHASQIPIAEPLDTKVKVRRIHVAKRVKRSQVRYNTEVPPPIVEVVNDSNFPSLFIARKLSRKGNMTE